MTEKEAIDIFEKVHSFKEQNDMRDDIISICHVLSQKPIDMCQVRIEIDTVNKKHPENWIIFNSIYQPQGNIVSLDCASADNLISDLKWKMAYLQAKQESTTFNEFYKAMRNIV